jgi:hypothetical protein
MVLSTPYFELGASAVQFLSIGGQRLRGRGLVCSVFVFPLVGLDCIAMGTAVRASAGRA